MQITVSGTQAPPPPPPGAVKSGGTPFLGVEFCRGYGHKVVACCTLGSGVGIAIVGIVAFISVFGTFRFLSFVVSLFINACGLLLSYTALFNSTFVATYFAFLRYPLGSGSMQFVAGALTYDALDIWGPVVGGFAMAFGTLAIGCHLWWRNDEQAFNLALLGATED